LVGHHVGVDFQLAQQRRRTLERVKGTLAPAGGALPVSKLFDGPGIDAGQHDLGGVVADVDAGYHARNEGHRNRPRLA